VIFGQQPRIQDALDFFDPGMVKVVEDACFNPLPIMDRHGAASRCAERTLDRCLIDRAGIGSARAFLAAPEPCPPTSDASLAYPNQALATTLDFASACVTSRNPRTPGRALPSFVCHHRSGPDSGMWPTGREQE